MYNQGSSPLLGADAVPDVVPAPVLHEARWAPAVQRLGRQQDGQDVQHTVGALVQRSVRSPTTYAQLCTELRVLHDVWGDRAQLDLLPEQHAVGK